MVADMIVWLNNVLSFLCEHARLQCWYLHSLWVGETRMLIKSAVPSQISLFSWYPGGQLIGLWHTKLPTVFTQRWFGWQARADEHSFTSVVQGEKAINVTVKGGQKGEPITWKCTAGESGWITSKGAALSAEISSQKEMKETGWTPLQGGLTGETTELNNKEFVTILSHFVC